MTAEWGESKFSRVWPAPGCNMKRSFAVGGRQGMAENQKLHTSADRLKIFDAADGDDMEARRLEKDAPGHEQPSVKSVEE